MKILKQNYWKMIQMRQIKHILIFILALATNVAKADMADFWHVYYNGVKIKEFSEVQNNREITLKIKDIKKTDSLTIMYYNDFHLYGRSFSLSLLQN